RSPVTRHRTPTSTLLPYTTLFRSLVRMEPGKVYKVTLQPLNTSNYFEAGHQLRIEVSSSNFPRFDRNLNTGGNNYDEVKRVIARDRKSTRLNSSHGSISYAVFCLK